MFANRILVAFLIIGVACFLVAHQLEKEIYGYIGGGAMIMVAVTYFSSPQLNWWWYRRNPPDVDPALRKLLEARCTYYQRLNEAQKTTFRQRLALYQIGGVAFTNMHTDEFPEDVKIISLISPVMLTMHHPDDEFLIEKFEQVVLYAHPFPSKQHEAWHICETYEEDGVLIFSVEHLIHGFMEPNRYFNIGLYEWSNAYLLANLQLTFPKLKDKDVSKLALIGRFEWEKFYHYLGLSHVNYLAIAITLFFEFPERFKEQLPELYQHLQGIFLMPEPS